MREVGPEHSIYQKIPWPAHLKQSEVPLAFPTSFLDLLGHNNPPTTNGASLVTTFEEGVYQRMLDNAARKVEIAHQISMLQGELAELNLSDEGLQKQSFACKVITSPFRRLSHDIIYNIILHCPRIYPPSASSITPKTHVPCVLAQVSRLWRACVLGQSALWNYIGLSCDEWYMQPIVVRNRLNLFSQRSAPAGGLSVNLYTTGASQKYDFLSALLCMGEVKNATLEQFKFKSFELHDLDSESDERRITWHSLASALSCLPYLRHLWLPFFEYFHFDDITTVASSGLITGSQLTILHLDNEFPSITQWHAILGLCSNLKAARLRVCPHGAESSTLLSTPGASLIHHHLEFLFLQINEPPPMSESSCSIIFSCTKFPRLKVLRLYFEGDVLRDLAYRSPGCLQGVFPVLEELHIPRPWEYLPDTWASLHPLFHAVPTITTLSHILTPQLLLEFRSFLLGSNPNRRHFPFPQLTHLYLQFQAGHYSRLDEDSEGIMSKSLIAIRRWQIANLSKRSVSATGRLANIVELREGTSMKISFTWYHSLDDPVISNSITDVKEYVEKLQKKCMEEDLSIEVELVGDMPNDLDGTCGSDLFRELHFQHYPNV